MNDVFLSYASGDRAVAQKLADALEAEGWSVWWDREIPYGKAFDQVIEEELNAARCVVVLWTGESVHSRWVKTEASAAADRERLIPVLLEDVPIPFEFKRIQTAMLRGWSGERDRPEFVQLLQSIRQMVGAPASPPKAGAFRPAASRFAWRKTLAVVGVLALLVAIGWGVARRQNDANERVASTSPATSPATSAEEGLRTESRQPAAPAAGQSRKAETAVAGATALPSVPGAFPIRIGDRIEEGVPAAGAGYIDAPGEKDVYVFNATAGERVYFRRLEYGKGMERIAWKLLDPDGTEVFSTLLAYGEPGVQRLRKAGTYRLEVGSEREPATGSYRLRLYAVAPPQQFSIAVGDTIKDNTPAEGAGYIETPGAKDVYVFNATPGQRVYFRRFEYGRGMERIAWKLTDVDANEVFNTLLAYSEPGVQVLRKGGAYRMEIGSDTEPATGTYRVQLVNVPPAQQFTVRIGEVIGENKPAAGAGTIESPGAKDLYTFTATAGQRVYFRRLEYGRGMERIEWKLVDPEGTEVFKTLFAYSEPGLQVLRKAGTYTLHVGSDTQPETGTYRLELTAGGG